MTSQDLEQMSKRLAALTEDLERTAQERDELREWVREMRRLAEVPVNEAYLTPMQLVDAVYACSTAMAAREVVVKYMQQVWRLGKGEAEARLKATVRRLELKPGDLVVLETDRPLSAQEAERLIKGWQEFTQFKAVALPHGVRVGGVMGDGEWR